LCFSSKPCIFESKTIEGLSDLAPIKYYRFQSSQMKFLSFLLLLFVLLVNPLSAQKKAQPSPVKLLVGGALELGGDRTGWVKNDKHEFDIIRGAQGVSLTTGIQFRPKAMDRIMVHATVGYKYWRTFTDGAHVRMTRIPLHLTAHYWLNDNLRVGLGVLTDRNVRFRGDGLGPLGPRPRSAGATWPSAIPGCVTTAQPTAIAVLVVWA